MKYEVSMDGGGSKLQVVLFDEDYRCVARARAGSVNSNFSSEETVLQNVRRCFEDLLKNVNVSEIACVYGAFTGNLEKAVDQLRTLVPVREVRRLGEARIGLLAGGIPGDGVLVLSGTGSDIYLVKDDVEKDVVGGWGALISDEGSGYFIGRMALNAVIRDFEGRGDHTSLTAAVCEEMKRPNVNNAVLAVYESGTAVARIAALSRLVSRAARQGDKTAQHILEENARLLAEQTAALLHRNPGCEGIPLVVAGGSWKNYSYFERFCRQIDHILPGMKVHRPIFEPVVGGVVASLFREKGAVETEDITLLLREFAQFAIDETVFTL